MKWDKFSKLGWLALAAVLLLAAGTSSNIFKIGDGTTSDKILEFNLGLDASNPKLKATTTSIDFAKDGTNYLPLGSGSGSGGGGINVIENPGFETGTTNWTNTGTGTFGQTTTASEIAFGNAAGEWNPSAAADKLTSDTQLIPNGIAGTLCILEFYAKGGGVSNITAKVYDGSDVLVDGSTITITDSTLAYKRYYSTFLCPASGESAYVEFEAAGDAGTLAIDNVHLGTKSLATGAAGGWKVYDSEVTYSATPVGWSLNQHSYVPYKDPLTGLWRLRFNITANITSTTSSTVTINGVVFEAGADNFQALVAAGSTSNSVARAYVNPNTGNVTLTHEISTGSFRVSGDVALESKPTWADFDGTVNVLNNSVVKSNSKVKLQGLTTGTINNGETVPYDSATVKYSRGAITHTGGVFTVDADGEYIVSGQLGSASTISLATTLRGVVNGSTTESTHIVDAASSLRYIPFRFTVQLSKGDTIEMVKDGSFTNFAIGDTESYISVRRDPLVSSEDAFGFGDALTTQGTGLVSFEKKDSLDISLSGDFSAGQPLVRIARVGNIVTLSWDDLAHTLNSQASSAVGFIPVEYRPPFTVRNLYASITGNLIRRAQVDSSGSLNFFYKDYAAASTSAASTQGGTLSWVVD